MIDRRSQFGGHPEEEPERSGSGERSVFQRLFELGEERVGQIAEEMLASPRFGEALGNAVQGALETKGRVDRNMQSLLSLLNVPSKADYQKLVTKIDALQGSIVNLNIKLDRILAAQKATPAPKPRTTPRARKKPSGAG